MSTQQSTIAIAYIESNINELSDQHEANEIRAFYNKALGALMMAHRLRIFDDSINSQLHEKLAEAREKAARQGGHM